MTDPASTVRQLFELMESRDWDGAAALLTPDVEIWWPVTGEVFVGSDFIEMQRAYPEGWSITVGEVIGFGGRVSARVRVDHGDERFWCHGFYDVDNGRVRSGIELWGTEGSEDPPYWRLQFSALGRPATETRS